MPGTLAFDAETSGLEDGCEVYVISVCDVDSLQCRSFMPADPAVGGTDHIEEALAYLDSAESTVSFNGSGFDLRVMCAALDPGSHGREIAARLALSSHDILFDFTADHGYYTSLASLCKGSLSKDKSGSGAEASEWWQAGEHDRVVSYCEDDARLTAELWNEGKDWNRLSRATKRGKIAHWELHEQGFRTVLKSVKAWTAKKPDTSWMTDESTAPDLRENIRWAVEAIRSTRR